MMIEMLRGMICSTCMVMGCLAIARSDWRIFRIIVGLFIVFVMTGEVMTSVNLASTHMHDLGETRKVGWPTIVAVILTVWFGRKWLNLDHSEPTR